MKLNDVKDIVNQMYLENVRGATLDLDIAAFLVNANDRVENIATDVIYFNNMSLENNIYQIAISIYLNLLN